MTEADKPLILDAKFHGLEFAVRRVERSAFADFEMFTKLPYIHLTIISTFADAKWNEWDKNGLGLIHQVTGYVETHMSKVVEHFFGDSLAFCNTAWRFEINSVHATRKQTPHAHLLMWHKELNHLVRRCDETCMNPQRLIGENIAAMLKKPGQDETSIITAFPHPVLRI